MQHARKDYNRIQDPKNIIPADEPVFLLRGQDVASPKTIRFWACVARELGAKQDIIDAALAQADKMDAWQNEHSAKIPDMPE